MEVRNITISEEILEVCPEFSMAAITCEVINSPFNASLWQEIQYFSSRFASKHNIEDIKKKAGNTRHAASVQKAGGKTQTVTGLQLRLYAEGF